MIKLDSIRYKVVPYMGVGMFITVGDTYPVFCWNTHPVSMKQWEIPDKGKESYYNLIGYFAAQT